MTDRLDAGEAPPRHTPFTGRTAELRRLTRRLEEARGGQGGELLLAGEPGIGKTRLLEEVARTARTQGALVLWGRCYEREAARPFGPFAEALGEYARAAEPDVLRADLGLHAAPLTRLVPAIRERLPDVPEPVPLQPNAERMRLLDAVAQALLALAARVPTVLVLDDLHWAEPGTVALLEHVARFAPRARLLVLGAYRDVEVAPQHPLTEVLGTLPREASYEQLTLHGLDADAVHELVEALTKRAIPRAWAQALARETSGNPFFLREVLLDLVAEGALGREDGSEPPALESLRLPDTVRQVVARRLARLPAPAHGLLRVAAAFTGGIDFEVARRVAGLDEQPALDALDAALAAQLLVAPGAGTTAYDFTHALVRHTLYEGLSPARQVRLHREIAETMEAVYGERATEHAAEIARHYHRSASLPGAERGVPHCLVAADRAERSLAFADVADHLRAALDILPAAAADRISILARRGLALVYARRFDDAVGVVHEASARIADSEGPDAAARYLAKVCSEANSVGGISAVPIDGLLRLGLEYAGERRDITWATLKEITIQREPDELGIPQDTPDRREIVAAFEAAQVKFLPDGRYVPVPWTSRAEIRARHPMPNRFLVVGDYRRTLPIFRTDAAANERQGQVESALYIWSCISKLHTALGEFAEARETSRRASALAERSVVPSFSTAQLVIAEDDWRLALDEGWDQPMENVGPGLGDGPVLARYRAIIHASRARVDARMGRTREALQMLESLLSAVDQAPAWAENYARLACDLAETLWLAGRTDHIEIIERNLREKVITPDFHHPMRDGRLALARVCALQHRYDEATDWFAKARTVLDEQGARPLRAIVDYDEALMYARRAPAGDREGTQALLDTALAQFRALGMPGWIRRGEALVEACAVSTRQGQALPSPASRSLAIPSRAPGSGVPASTIPARRIVTLIFADMEGSTRLLGVLGDAFLPVLERHRAVLGAAAAAHGGAGYTTGGNGCVFLFGSASSALAAAVQAQRALAAECWPGGVSVRVRMAIHAGEVADVGDELFGMALHQVSRILAVAHGGQVVLSEAAVGLIEQLAPDISLLDLGVHRLRDIVRPVRLHQAVAEGVLTTFPPLDTAASGASHLPAPTTSFVGRQQALRELVDVLASRRLVTLTGAGGSGKTRLALEAAKRVADQHRDGACLVELAGLATGALVPEAVLGALGMREPTAGRSASEFLCAALADRDLLLVLDNCEHVVAGVAALVSELLPACAALHVLATSREPLRLPGEVERPVLPLDLPDPDALESLERLAEYDAVRLLVERGGDVRPGFRLTDGNAAALVRICAELAGLPLAIELAAARLRTLSPEQVAARLGEQLDLLTHGGRSRPDRQQTMRATLDWSHQLLAPHEQLVFRRLSVFAGGFTLDAAELVADGDGVERAGVADAVERLASRSMVTVDHDRAEPRLRMLEPVRQYAAERLREAGERDRVVRRHLEWVVALAAKAGSGFMREPGRWSARLRDEQDNVRQAMESALAGVDPDAALRIAAALGYPWFTTGQPEARAWVVRALEAAPGAPELICARALLGAGLLAENVLDYDQALVHLRRALAISRAVGARALEGWVLMQMGRAAWAIDVDARPPAAWFEDALRIFREVDEPAGIGWMLSFLAEEELMVGDIEGAATRAREAFDVGTRLGLLQFVGQSRRLLAMVAARRGQEADAERLLEEAGAAFEQAGDRWTIALILTMTAHLVFNRGDEARALAPLRQALRHARDIGSGERMTYAVELAAHVLHHRGRAPEVATLVGAVEAVYLRLPRKETNVRPRQLGWTGADIRAPSAGGIRLAWSTGFEALASAVSEGFDEHRVAGRSLSLERAADRALRVLDEELALAATPAGHGNEAAGEAPPAPTATPSNDAGIFHRDGEYWTLAYAGRTVRVRDAKGLHYIAHLLAAPGTEVHVGDLVALGANAADGAQDAPRSVAQGDLGTVLDPRARAEYKRRLDDLRDELAEATSAGDVGRAAGARHEIEQITGQLAAAYGLGGRARMAGDPVERLRKAVTNQIRRILERIRTGHPALGLHLEKGLRTGVFCSYAPERPVTWRL